MNLFTLQQHIQQILHSIDPANGKLDYKNEAKNMAVLIVSSDDAFELAVYRALIRTPTLLRYMNEIKMVTIAELLATKLKQARKNEITQAAKQEELTPN